ncbi:MAG: type II toxin-antitoxin system VapC family toxin [Solirubrobacterales bacterium]|nr:type II toxin-antitoxin system VapC family toxin [Solirubrobacterales bacterium]
MAGSRRLILDTGVLVAMVRGRLRPAAITDGDDIAIPAVVVAEYLAGTLLDPAPGRSAAQRQFLEEMLGVLPVHGYDLNVAEHHAELLAFTRRSGKPRGPHDLIVAATARATGRTLLTTDRGAGFEQLPEVRSLLVDESP